MAKTRAELLAYANANINTNGINSITGEKLNTMNVDEIEAMALLTDIPAAGKVKYSDSSDTEGYLINKTAAGVGITFASKSDATYGDQLEISISPTIAVDEETIGDVDGGNYAEFNENGELRLYGDATQWDDLRVSVASTKTGGTKDPDWSKVDDDGAGSQGVFTYAFDQSTEEELYFAVQLPHSWMQGSDIESHVHWIPLKAGVAGRKVSWGLEYTWADIGDTFPATTIIYGDTTALGSITTANSHSLTELGTISATGKTFSSMLICRVFRDATGTGGTDDFTGDAGLLEIDFHYQLDSLGSNEEYVKY